MGSNLGSLRDEESEERLRQAQELRALREKIEEKMGSDGTLAKFGRWSQQDLLVGWRRW